MARGFAIPIYNPPLSRENVEEGGQVLFRNFVREEFENQGLEDHLQSASFDEGGDSAEVNFLEENDGNANSLHFRSGNGSHYRSAESLGIGTPDGYKNDTWSRYGRELRMLADDFSRSSQGEKVRRRVQTVNLNDINRDRFLELMLELFTEGVSKERVLALFCFCSNLLIRAARENRVELIKSVFTWSLEYIRSTVCEWVYRHGGWGQVFSTFYKVMRRVLACGALAAVIIAGGVYIKKNW